MIVPPEDRKDKFTPNRILFVQRGQRWLHPDEISRPKGEQILQITDNNQPTRGGDFEVIRIKPSALISIDLFPLSKSRQMRSTVLLSWRKKLLG